MIRPSLLVIIAALATPLAAADKPDQLKQTAVARDVEALQGSWLFVLQTKYLKDGVEKAKTLQGKIIITNVSYHLFFLLKDGGYRNYTRGVLTIDPAARPRSIDFKPFEVESPTLAIYELTCRRTTAPRHSRPATRRSS